MCYLSSIMSEVTLFATIDQNLLTFPEEIDFVLINIALITIAKEYPKLTAIYDLEVSFYFYSYFLFLFYYI